MNYKIQKEVVYEMAKQYHDTRYRTDAVLGMLQKYDWLTADQVELLWMAIDAHEDLYHQSDYKK